MADGSTAPQVGVHDNLMSALAAAQGEMENASKDGVNDHLNKSDKRKGKYATLASARNAAIPPLSRHGIAVTQEVRHREGGPFLVTAFHHGATKEVKEDEGIPLLFAAGDMQKLGSAMTYARRYGLLAMAGLAPEDDDAEGAGKQEVTERREPPPSSPFNPEARRTAMKRALSSAHSSAEINGIVADAKFKADFDRLPEPMQSEVRAHTAERRRIVAPPPPPEDQPDDGIGDSIPY